MDDQHQMPLSGDDHTGILDHITLDPSVLSHGTMIDTLDLGNAAPAITITSGGAIANPYVYTGITGAMGTDSISIDWGQINHSHNNRLTLQGDNADIEINGESVVSMLRDIRDRLNILQVSEQMEQEWDDLRELRQQYEDKLAECREKSRAWAALKKT